MTTISRAAAPAAAADLAAAGGARTPPRLPNRLNPTPSRLASLALLGWALALFAGCGSPAGNSTAHNPVLPNLASAAVLRPGDSLIVSLQGIPDPSNNAVQVDDQGTVTLPLISSISAGGSTTSSLAQRIRDAYLTKKFYTSLDVNVTVTERFVYVGGEVQHPGRITWTPDLSLAKAIQSAGGFTLYAKETAVSLVRERTAYTVDVLLAQRAPAEDPPLMPGDSLQVPRSPF